MRRKGTAFPRPQRWRGFRAGDPDDPAHSEKEFALPSEKTPVRLSGSRNYGGPVGGSRLAALKQ